MEQTIRARPLHEQSPGVLIATCDAALTTVDGFYALVRGQVAAQIMPGGRWDNAQATRHQRETHGLAWLATYANGLRALLGWARSLYAADQFGELEQLILGAGFGEYLNQIAGGIAMTQVETIRPGDFDLAEIAETMFKTTACAILRREGFDIRARARLAELIRHGSFGGLHRGDEALDQIAENLRRFVQDRVVPNAHFWHCRNEYIPLPVIQEMSELGIFGLTVPEAFGGSGLGKLAMCIASEELSRGYIGVGSLGTRAEIAAELIRLGGTPAQQEKYLPLIASGEILPTAVFTEPNTGSDLASLSTRAERVTKADGSKIFRVTGNKTWITHAARADLMTLLVRTEPAEAGYKGLSMLLAEKPRGDDANPFPAAGMSGGEIEVLGYRGMKEYEIRFDGFEVPEDALLGGIGGQGFKQLMETFESARIQTAARAVGVAQNALELGLNYALDRSQFGQPIFGFPRVADKLVWMVVETMLARQLSYFAAREKDLDKRCDIEAGMAKLLAARTAWSNADNALQIHGGNGFALEYPISRVLCDARILNIFEGAGEIQAQVIARGLLAGVNWRGRGGVNMVPLLIDEPGPAIRRLRINRPEARNAINQDVRDALFAALVAARDDPQVRALVLAGADGMFSAGGDLPSMVGLSEAAALARMQDGHRIVSLLWTYPKPVLAAVERVAAGAAAGIALLADRVVIGRNASLLLPFLRLGLLPDWGLMQTVTRRAGLGHAARIFMDSAAVTGEEAAAIGLADQAVDDAEVMTQSLAAAASLASLPMAAFARMKSALRDAAQPDPLNLGLEAAAQAACLAGPEFVEGYAAFREKRKAVFQ